MPRTKTEQHHIDASLVWAGFRQLVPISAFVTAFGAAFGLAATQAGIGDIAAIAMSALVFAGAAQFATLELWGTQIPLAAVVLTVFAINARHLLMGATLYPWLQHLSPAKRYGIMAVTSDANWAMSMDVFNRGKPGFGVLLGGGLALWLFWVIGTAIGAYFGNAITDPKLLGLDMIMGCFLLSMVVSGEKNPRMMVIWAAAALSSLLAYWYFPENSHVIVGALVGGGAGALIKEAGDDH